MRRTGTTFSLFELFFGQECRKTSSLTLQLYLQQFLCHDTLSLWHLPLPQLFQLQSVWSQISEVHKWSSLRSGCFPGQPLWGNPQCTCPSPCWHRWFVFLGFHGDLQQQAWIQCLPCHLVTPFLSPTWQECFCASSLQQTGKINRAAWEKFHLITFFFGFFLLKLLY